MGLLDEARKLVEQANALTIEAAQLREKAKLSAARRVAQCYQNTGEALRDLAGMESGTLHSDFQQQLAQVVGWRDFVEDQYKVKAEREEIEQ